jgi:hypothetical protein
MHMDVTRVTGLAAGGTGCVGTRTAVGVDLTLFRCAAIVDVMVIEVNVGRTTTFPNVQRIVQRALNLPKRPSVSPRNHAGGLPLPDSCFQIRLHDLTREETLRRLSSAIDRELGLTTQPTVRELEVAVDFFSKSGEREQLMALRRYLVHTAQATGNLALQWDPKSESYRQFERISDEGALLVKSGETSWRIYLKDCDHSLPMSNVQDHRVRVEVNLRGAALPDAFHDLITARDASFQSLTPYFKFRSCRVPERAGTSAEDVVQAVARRAVLDRVGTVGLEPHPRTRRKFHPATAPDKALHRRIRDALRNLSTSWNKRARA